MRNNKKLEDTTMDVSTLVPVGIHHPAIQQYLAVKNNTKVLPENLVALEGSWALTRAFRANLAMHAFFVCPELLRNEAARQLTAQIIAKAVPSYVVSEKVMRKIVEWEGPDGLAALVALRCFGWKDIPLRQHNRLVVLDGLELPGNIGTIIRCADGAGAEGIILTNCKKRLAHPKLIHASMGSVFTFPIIEAETFEVITWLKRHNFKVVTTDSSASTSYREADYQGRIAVVMGSERHGIAQVWHEAQDVSVSIPMHGQADSLNVGNAAALVLYEVFYQQKRVG